MKKTIYNLAILCFLTFVYSNDSKAQGNLQFNKVKFVSVNDTVPANKVWKVESILYSNTNYGAYINLDNQSILVRYILYSNGGTSQTSSIWEMKFPFWMPAGSFIAASTNVNLINIIEYNIIP